MMRSGGSGFDVLPGSFTVATLPFAAANYHKLAWTTDRPGGPGFMVSDGNTWDETTKRIESFPGTTNGSGDFTVVFSPAYDATPNIQPVTFPAADSTTRVRVTVASATGFTVRTERNNTLTVLGLDVLGLGVSAVPSVPVRVLVVES